MKMIKFSERLVAAALGFLSMLLAPPAFAADTHDYSSYITLKSDATCNGGYPGADKWNPEGIMSNEYCYLVPTGRKITSTVKQNQPGGIWPGMELAIQGQLASQVNDDRSWCATMPPLALLPGGKLMISYGFGTVKGDTLDIRGTAANPALIECYYSAAADRNWLYPQLDVAVTGDADGVVRFRYTGTDANYSDFQRAFRATKGFANFHGTVIVDGARTWLRPETSATTFDIGGTLWVTNGASVYIATVSPTFGSLVLSSDATLQLNGGKFVTVTNAFSMAEGAKIVVDAVSNFKTDYDTAATYTPLEVSVLSVCGAANAASVDRDALFAAIKAGSEGNLYASGVPRLVFVEHARADGGVDFKVSHEPIVKQTKSCTSGNGPYGDGKYTDYLSDKSAISPEKDYYDPGYNIYFNPSSYTFPGRSLSLAGMVGIYNWSSFTVADLRLLDGAWFRTMKKDCTVYLYGRATLCGTPNFRLNGTGTFFVYSTLAGTGDLIVALDVEKCRSEGSAYLGYLSLEGDNSAWSGRALVGCGRESTADIGLTNLTLKVASAAGLGGAVDAFTFDAVKIADTCTLDITDTATFAAANRGWCFMDGSTVNVSADKVATMCESVTFGGASVKKGAGTLMLGGSAKFYDAVNDEAADTPNGATFRVSAGSLGVVATNALDGVGVTFASGASMSVDVETTGDLKSFGARNVSTETPFAAVGGGAIPVSFTGAFAGDKDTVAICTISSTAATPTFALPSGHSGLKVVSSAWRTNDDGTRTLELKFAKLGFVISFR